MKTFVVGLCAVVAVSGLLSSEAHAQLAGMQLFPAQTWGQYLKPNSVADQKALAMNVRGLQYCLSMRGKVVGNGECTALAVVTSIEKGARAGVEKGATWVLKNAPEWGGNARCSFLRVGL